MKKRITSFVLSFLLVASVFSCLATTTTSKANAATQSQRNIVARANYMWNSTWTCKRNVSGWKYKYTFYAGRTYHLPYAWPVSAGAYIGYGISVQNFLNATRDANNAFYTRKSYLAGTNAYSTYYGNDCSGFVSYCWGIGRNTTSTIPGRSRYIGRVSTSNATYTLQLGDALNSTSVGHVVLVTGLSYNSNGSIRQIEITEQTPPQLKRSYYTPSSLANKYYNSYYIYRYGGSVPASPGGNTVSAPSQPSSSGGSFSISPSSITMDVNTTRYISETSSSTVTWTSSNPSVATVSRYSSAQGKVVAKSAGSATITATNASGKKMSCTVYVYSGYNGTYYSRYTGKSESLIDALKSVGVSNPNYTLRSQIAEANGISGYSGTADQNTKLLKLLKLGKLVRPGARSSSAPSGGSGGCYVACASSHKSLVDALKSIGAVPDVSSDQVWPYQLKIAAANNVSNYRGTEKQNIYLLGLLKKGALKKP